MENILQKTFLIMKEGITPENLTGTCQLTIDKDTRYLTYSNQELTYSSGFVSKPDVTIKMSENILAHILENQDSFDLRDPKLLGSVTVEGNIELCRYLFDALKRPSEKIKRLIAETEKKCSDYKELVTEIKCVEKPTEEEIIISLDKSIPMVITNALEHWEILGKNFDYVKSRYGHLHLRPVIGQSGAEYETLDEFVEKIENSNGIYTEGCDLPPALWSRFQLPYFETSSLSTPQIWMGSKSGDKPCTNLHRDCINGMLANVFGKKKIIFFSPDQTQNMYPVKAFNNYQPCEITDVCNVNTEKFPRFKEAKNIEVVLNPGDLLILPAFWYHCVYAIENVFSVGSGLKWSYWENINSSGEVVNFSI